MKKVPAQYKFLDLSDYARPFAEWLVRLLMPTAITPIHITWAYTVLGLIAAGLYLTGAYPAQVIAGLFLLVKSGLDAADGALARARNRPSRVGRFLDSLMDIALNMLVFAAIGWAEMTRAGNAAPLLWAALAFASVTWQVTVYNYFSVVYRHATGGDKTSQVDESKAENYPYDNPDTVRLLLRLYTLVYAWQDKLIAGFDCRWLGGGTRQAPVAKWFMTLLSAIGLGIHLLVICLFSVIGQPMLALYAFLTVFNLYWLVLLLIRRRDNLRHIE